MTRDKDVSTDRLVGYIQLQQVLENVPAKNKDLSLLNLNLPAGNNAITCAEHDTTGHVNTGTKAAAHVTMMLCNLFLFDHEDGNFF